MNKPALSVLCLALGVSTATLAANENIVISGVIPGYVTIHPASHGLAAAAPAFKKAIQFEKIELSPAAQKYLADHIGKPQAPRLMAANDALPPQTELGMNNVPVLDQGAHGTCVTFATTAALDAELGHTDYISQLCNLELGAYLAKKDRTYPSGWEGSTNEIVLSQIQKYGIITQDYQKQTGCANVRAYPLTEARSTGKPMKDTDFLQHSQKIMDNLSWKTWLEYHEALTPQADMQAVLTNVKQALANNHRIVFATLIDENAGENGASGNFKARYDSWVLTSKIADDAKANKINAGHALVITGYDDNAVVTDTFNVQHKGVLTIRNSWGSDAGDNGTYYMSYDYFTSLAVEVKELVPTKA